MTGIPHEMKQHDTLPQITSALGGFGDLTGATVKFVMRKVDNLSPKIAAAGSFDDRTAGLVRYSWLPVDTDTPGTYDAEWEVTYSSGKKQTFPGDSYLTVIIVGDLDGV
jgi:hypothetical protein